MSHITESNVSGFHTAEVLTVADIPATRVTSSRFCMAEIAIIGPQPALAQDFAALEPGFANMPAGSDEFSLAHREDVSRIKLSYLGERAVKSGGEVVAATVIGVEFRLSRRQATEGAVNREQAARMWRVANAVAEVLQNAANRHVDLDARDFHAAFVGRTLVPRPEVEES